MELFPLKVLALLAGVVVVCIFIVVVRLGDTFKQISDLLDLFKGIQNGIYMCLFI